MKKLFASYIVGTILILSVITTFNKTSVFSETFTLGNSIKVKTVDLQYYADIDPESDPGK